MQKGLKVARDHHFLSKPIIPLTPAGGLKNMSLGRLEYWMMMQLLVMQTMQLLNITLWVKYFRRVMLMELARGLETVHLKASWFVPIIK